MLFIQNIITDEFIKALCRMLLHSLWQGLVISIFAGFVILISRSWPSALRYIIKACLFCLFIIATVITFFYELNNTATSIPDQGSIISYASNEAISGNQINSGNSNTIKYFLTQALEWSNSHASWIVAAWFFIFMMKLFRMMKAVRHLQHIRNFDIYEPSIVWKNKLREFVSALRLQVPIRFMESGLIHVPVVFGFLKPIILVPFGILTNLPPEQAEAILLHELAHIKRRDFIFNLLQNFIEKLFFFNLPVLWLSQSIREEREYCCDDLAVGITGNKKAFIQALVTFQEYKQYTYTYEMTFPGTKNQLLNRVQRIINGRNKKLTGMEKISFLLTLLITGLMAISFTTINNRHEPAKKTFLELIPANLSLVKINVAGTEKKSTSPKDIRPKIQKARTITSYKKESANNFTQTSEKITDTIPKCASQEYIDGYNAGMKYKESTMADSNGLYTLRKKIEALKGYDKKMITKDKPLDFTYRQKVETLKSKLEYYKNERRNQQYNRIRNLKYNLMLLDYLKNKPIDTKLMKMRLLENKLLKENFKYEKNKSTKWENEKLNPGKLKKKIVQ
jgi:beta-lactamase regulating signal transducer with metallopeptidase domain